MIDDTYVKTKTLWQKIRYWIGKPEYGRAYYGCGACGGEIDQMGPDGIDVCTAGCGIVEGQTNAYFDLDTEELVDL